MPLTTLHLLLDILQQVRPTPQPVHLIHPAPLSIHQLPRPIPHRPPSTLPPAPTIPQQVPLTHLAHPRILPAHQNIHLQAQLIHPLLLHIHRPPLNIRPHRLTTRPHHPSTLQHLLHTVPLVLSIVLQVQNIPQLLQRIVQVAPSIALLAPHTAQLLQVIVQHHLCTLQAMKKMKRNKGESRKRNQSARTCNLKILYYISYFCESISVCSKYIGHSLVYV